MGDQELRKFSEYINNVIGSPTVSHIMRMGDLAVQLNFIDSQKLLSLNSIGGRAISCKLPLSASLSQGFIYDVPLDIEDEEISLTLRDQGVISAHRFIIANQQKGRNVRLNFNVELPSWSLSFLDRIKRSNQAIGP